MAYGINYLMVEFSENTQRIIKIVMMVLVVIRMLITIMING